MTTWRKPTTALIRNQYILTYSQYTAQYTRIYHLIHVHTGTNPFIQVWLCISQYILVWTRIYWYKTIRISRMNAVFLGTRPYIRVWNILQKGAWFRDSNHWSHARLFIPLRHECWYFWSPLYDISKTDWDLGMPRHITCWLAGCQLSGPDKSLVLTLFWRWVSSLSRPGRRGPVANECHALSLGPELYQSPSHYASSDWARSLKPYTCSCKCARAIKPDAKHIKLTCVGRLDWTQTLASPKKWRGEPRLRFHFLSLDR